MAVFNAGADGSRYVRCVMALLTPTSKTNGVSILVDNIVYMTMTGTLRASVHWKMCLSGPGFYLPLFMDLIYLDSSSLLVFAQF